MFSSRLCALPVLVPMLLIAQGCVAPSATTAPALSYEGLAPAASRRFDSAEFRPGVDFTRYKAVHIDDPVLEFRTPDAGSGEFPLSADQKRRFHDMLAAAFADEFAGQDGIAVVDHSGPDVLELDVRVLDIRATVPPRTVGRVGRGAIALEASGSVTLVIEIRDSLSGEILARGVESREVAGAATRRGSAMITLWEDVDALCDRWAAASRTGLEALVAYDGSG